MTPSASVFDADPSSGLPARAREERVGRTTFVKCEPDKQDESGGK